MGSLRAERPGLEPGTSLETESGFVPARVARRELRPEGSARCAKGNAIGARKSQRWKSQIEDENDGNTLVSDLASSPIGNCVDPEKFALRRKITVTIITQIGRCCTASETGAYVAEKCSR